MISNKEGDSVSPSGYRTTFTTADSSRIAKTTVVTTPSAGRHGRPLQYSSSSTSQYLKPQPLTTPSTKLLKWPHVTPYLNDHRMTTTWPPYFSQAPSVSSHRPQRPLINTTLSKTQDEELWLGEKLERTGEGNQVYKRPRGQGRGRGNKRGKEGRRLRAGSVRLVSVDGLSDRGRVEIFIRGQWGTVCDDLFTSKAGTVVCRQLGFLTALAVMKRAGLGEADNSVSILLDDVECEGGENSLLECKRSRVGKHNCSHAEDVGVICG